MELKTWLEIHHQRISGTWLEGLRSSHSLQGEEGDETLGEVLEHLVAFLPHCLGDQREDGETVWHQGSYLYGSLALRRALSVGEVVEELGLLREILLKLLLKAPPENWRDRGTHRDLLTLNRLLDQGVVRASVAYVDDLFFAHLQGSGIPEGVTVEFEEETKRQFEALLAELDGSGRDG